MNEKGVTRDLGPTEQYLNMCHRHGNQNICVALTIHTRTTLDLGSVQVGLQEMQHQSPQLTSRIKKIGNRASLLWMLSSLLLVELYSKMRNVRLNVFKKMIKGNIISRPLLKIPFIYKLQNNNREMFVPMECPVLPLDTQFECSDVLHTKFNTETGPLWRVQILSLESLEKHIPSIIGPEVEAILEDDSTIDTRWRYLLRYMQGRLNRDIENFSDSGGEEEEGRSVIFITFHPSITDIPGALVLAKQFMDILELKLENQDSPLSLGGGIGFPPTLESLLPQPDSAFHLGDLVPMVKAVSSHFIPLRKSPCEPLLVNSENLNGNEPRSRLLRGWLSEKETLELGTQCGLDDVSLHGIVLASVLIATARVCSMNNIPSSVSKQLRASISINLRQYFTQGSRNGVYSAMYDELFDLPEEMTSADEEVTSHDLWMLAGQLTNSHNTAKANKQAVRHVRMISKMVAASGLESAFKDMNIVRRTDYDLNFNMLGDLGHVFRTDTTPNQDLQVRLEDVLVLVSGQNMGYPISHSAHVFRGRLNYSLTYYTNYLSTETALLIRDETMHLLRIAAEPQDT